MGVKRDIDSGRKDALGRAIKVSANAGQKASAGAIAKAPSVQTTSLPAGMTINKQYFLNSLNHHFERSIELSHRTLSVKESADAAKKFFEDKILRDFEQEMGGSDEIYEPKLLAFLDRKRSELGFSEPVEIDRSQYDWKQVLENNSRMLRNGIFDKFDYVDTDEPSQEWKEIAEEFYGTSDKDEVLARELSDIIEQEAEMLVRDALIDTSEEFEEE